MLLFLDEPVDFIQQTGQSLYFVYNDLAPWLDSTQFGGKMPRMCQKSLICLLGEQIDHMGVR